jgi:hypothetical protein
VKDGKIDVIRTKGNGQTLIALYSKFACPRLGQGYLGCWTQPGPVEVWKKVTIEVCSLTYLIGFC